VTTISAAEINSIMSWLIFILQNLKIVIFHVKLVHDNPKSINFKKKFSIPLVKLSNHNFSGSPIICPKISLQVEL
jgi:hypothetical protein